MAKRIEAAFPMQKLPDDTRTLYLEEFTEMADQIGRERTEQAVSNALKFCRFFPTIAEIHGSAPAKHVDPWRTPTPEEMADAEEARKSPEAKQFFALLRQIKSYDRMDAGRKREPTPTSEEIAKGLEATKHIREKL